MIQQPGERRVLEDHHGVERVAVLGQRVGDEAVVGRIRGGGEQPAVEAEDVGLVVVLVLVAAAAGDLDDDVDLDGHPQMILDSRPRGQPLPRSHGSHAAER